MKYKEGYKYQLVEDEEIELLGCPEIDYDIFDSWDGNEKALHVNKFITLTRKPVFKYFLYLKSGYAWDGATGAVDTKNFMVPSVVHDAILEAIGLGFLPADSWKPWIDNFLIELCKRRKMNWFRRRWVYRAVRWLGDPQGSKPKEIMVAP